MTLERAYEIYEEKLVPLDIWMNPIGAGAEPNYLTQCMLIEGNGMCKCTVLEDDYTYEKTQGRSCPMEILEAFEAFGVYGKLLYKPMHLQQMFWNHEFVTVDGSRRNSGDLYNSFIPMADESRYIYNRRMRLPAYPDMTEDEQNSVIDIIFACFNEKGMERAVL